jgi:ornithine cyclodeaminase/alanine dehydrogenase-like protein (mu-crystallin family)
MLYLTEAEVASVLTMDLALDAVAAAFRKMALDEAMNPPRQRVQTEKVLLHVLPAAAKTLQALGFKAYTSGPNGTQFKVYLFDAKQGGLQAILEADYLGRMRTGAASGVATKKLARADATRLGVFGAGGQARTQIEAICKVRAISKVTVFSRTHEKAVGFAEEMSVKCGVDVEPVDDPKLAATGQDIVVTATTSRDPVLKGEWLSEGVHLNLIGSNFLAKSEADAEVFKDAMVCVDSREQARLAAGDFLAPIERGYLSWSDIREFSHVFTGRYPGREEPGDRTIFKSLGLGIEDLAVAVKVVELAKSRGLGRTIDL